MTEHQLTKNQDMVLTQLGKANAPLSAYDLLDQLREKGLKAPLQIYRALDKLTELGLAHRLETLNAFVACAHPDCHENELIAFGICEKCNKVWEFSDDEVSHRLNLWAEARNFTPHKTSLEIRGVCAKCA